METLNKQLLQTSNTIGRYSGENCLPYETVSSGDRASVRFKTDPWTTRTGWRLEVSGGLTKKRPISEILYKNEVFFPSPAVGDGAVPAIPGNFAVCEIPCFLPNPNVK